MATKRTNRRSSLEVDFEACLKRDKIKYKYEPYALKYVVPDKKYKPDFEVNGKSLRPTIIETKGHFTSSDRHKMLLVKEQYPDLRFIMVFGNPNNKLSSKSKTTYSDWCKKHGFEWYSISDFLNKDKSCRLFLTQKLKTGKLKTQATQKKKLLANLQSSILSNLSVEQAPNLSSRKLQDTIKNIKGKSRSVQHFQNRLGKHNI